MLFTFPVFIHEFNIPHSFLFLKIVDHPAEVGAFHFGEEGRGVLASGKPQKREGTELLIQVFPGFLSDSNMGFRRQSSHIWINRALGVFVLPLWT